MYICLILYLNYLAKSWPLWDLRSFLKETILLYILLPQDIIILISIKKIGVIIPRLTLFYGQFQNPNIKITDFEHEVILFYG